MDKTTGKINFLNPPADLSFCSIEYAINKYGELYKEKPKWLIIDRRDDLLKLREIKLYFPFLDVLIIDLPVDLWIISGKEGMVVSN